MSPILYYVYKIAAIFLALHIWDSALMQCHLRITKALYRLFYRPNRTRCPDPHMLPSNRTHGLAVACTSRALAPPGTHASASKISLHTQGTRNPSRRACNSARMRTIAHSALPCSAIPLAPPARAAARTRCIRRAAAEMTGLQEKPESS